MPTEHNDRLRRLWRFLKNPGFIPERVYPQLIRALAPCWPKALPLPLAMSFWWPHCPGREGLWPLWACACWGNWKGLGTSRNRLEQAFIEAVTSAEAGVALGSKLRRVALIRKVERRQRSVCLLPG